MSETPTTQRRKGERRKIPDRRSASDRRVLAERRHGERRVAAVDVDRERRGGVDRRARVLSSLSIRDHIIVHALRRLIGRLYQLAQGHPRAGKAEERLAKARSEILKLDPNLYQVAKIIDGLKGGAIAKLEEFQHAHEMLARFLPQQADESAPKRKAPSRNGAKSTKAKGGAAAKKTATAKKKTAKKKTTRQKTSKKRTAKTKASPAAQT